MKLSHALACLVGLGLLSTPLQAGVIVYPTVTIGTAADAWSTTDPGLGGWYYGDIRNSGTVGVTTTYDHTSSTAAATYPGSQGSLEFTLTSGSDKAGFVYSFDNPFALGGLVGASYDWYRSSTSTNPQTQAPALFFWVDVDGDLSTSDTIGLKYEAVYNGFGQSMPEDAWQTSVIDASTNLWSWDDANHAWNNYITLAQWLTYHPNAIVTGMGVDVGSGWNGEFSGAVDFIAVNNLFFDFQVAPSSSVPEPTTIAIWGMFGGLGLIATQRRRRQSA